MQAPPRQRTAEEEKARAAARQAEKELWERTRGAGSAVFKLAEAGRIKPKATRQREEAKSNAATSSSSPTASTSASASHVSVDHANGSRQTDIWSADEVLPPLEEVESKLYEPVNVPSADVLLSRGICDYTLLPKTLGRGKFSTVFVASKHGELHAIKHTALFPHHQLIATRLLREPTLLAELPPHPNLVTVKETIRTPGHFYLVEEYLNGYVTLEALLPMLNPTPPHILPLPAAERILTQLLSAVHAIHVPLQICHRDIKPENILIHPDTLQLKLLDFGLATHFSKSEPKLSTCCGSPAFHCPEIVKALASPPGSSVYMGPEVDAWTCGVTMLRCLTGARFPLGATHSSLRGMSIRAQRAVAGIADPGMREKVGALLEMDGKKRMKMFDEMVVEQEKILGEPDRSAKRFKSTTFIPANPTHSIKLPLIDSANGQETHALATPGFTTPITSSRRTTPSNSRPPSPSRGLNSSAQASQGTTIVALNPTHQSPERVVSFVKYCLRCAGILYHTWPDMSGLKKSTKHGLFSSHASQPTTHVSTAFAEAVGSPLDAVTQPSTPLFPPSLAGFEDRHDGFAHVQVFQCVIELPEEKEESALSGAMGQFGQLSLVQSIMAAFSRKPAASPPAGQTVNKTHQANGKASSPSPGPRPHGKRSLSTPAQPRQNQAQHTSTSGTGSSKDGSVRCLTFFMIVKFPHTHQQPSIARQAVSRASSYFGAQGPAVQQQTGRSNRSRASSAAGALSGESGSRNAAFDGVAAKGERRSESPTLDIRLKNPPLLPEGDAGRATVASHLPASRQPNRSPSTSRPASRTRKRSSRSIQKRAKVYFQVTDDRAADAVREALSVGGTVDPFEVDESRGVGAHLNGSSHDVTVTGEQPLQGGSRRSRRRTRDSNAISLNAWPQSHEGQSVPNSPTTPMAKRTPTLTETVDEKDEMSTEEQPRGRSMTSNRARFSSNDTITGSSVVGGGGGSTTGIRAPSQLSSVALKEESPATDDLMQTLDSLTRTLSEIISGAQTNASPSSRSTMSSPQLEHARPSSTSIADMVQITYDGRQSGLLAQTRLLLQSISRILRDAERRGFAALEETISPVSFALFAALSPALGIIPTETLGLPASSTATHEAQEAATTLRGLAMASFDLVARTASPREVFLAVQERIELLGSSLEGTPTKDERERRSEDEHDDRQSPHLEVQIPFPGARFSKANNAANAARPKLWSAALEMAGLLHVLGVSVRRLRTQKPVQFIEPLVSLVPRATHGVLRADTLPPKTGGTGSMTISPATSNEEDGTTYFSSSGSSNGVKSSTGGEALPPSYPQLAACEIGLGTIALCGSLAKWTREMGEEAEKGSEDSLLMLFYSSLIALLPELPKPKSEVFLADVYFHHFVPRYSVTGPQDKSKLQQVLPTIEALSNQFWTQMRDLISLLRIEIERQALEQTNTSSVVQNQEESTMTSATKTMGAFMLLVNLEAQRGTIDGAAAVQSPQWSKAEAMHKLRRSFGLLVACLGNGPPATISKDGSQSLGGLTHLADVALTWTLWCSEQIARGVGEPSVEDEDQLLDDEEAIVLVNTLATHAALCPRPAARQISMYIVRTTLTRLIQPAMARELLLELIAESPYPQLRSASVGLARTLIAEELDASRTNCGGKPFGPQFATPEFMQSLGDVLFTAPGDPERVATSDPDGKFAAEMKSYVDENAAWLNECLAFVYLIVTKDGQAQRTNICSAETLGTIKQGLLHTTVALVRRSREALASITTGAGASAEKKEFELALSVLDVAVERATEAIERASERTKIS